MTRAKTHLIMTWRKEVTTFFNQGFKVNKTERSRFLDSLMSKNQDTEKRKAEKCDLPSSNGNTFSRGNVKRSNPNTSSQDDLLALPTPKSVLTKNSGNLSHFRSAHSTKSTQDTNTAKTILRTRAIKRDDDEKWKRIHALKNSQRMNKKKAEDQNETTMTLKANGSSSFPPPVDSTMFFSVGSTVKHPVHGKGNVCPPPEEDSMLVRIKFISGLEMNFPVTGSSLTQIFGTY